MHMHHGSEHTFNEKHYDLEMHFVHKSDDGHLAVIGVLCTEQDGFNVLVEAHEEYFDNLNMNKRLNANGHMTLNNAAFFENLNLNR